MTLRLATSAQRRILLAAAFLIANEGEEQGRIQRNAGVVKRTNRFEYRAQARL